MDKTDLAAEPLTAKQLTSTPKVYSNGEECNGTAESGDLGSIVGQMFVTSETSIEPSGDNSTVIEPRNGFKEDFNSLNKRLASYVERIKSKDRKLELLDEALKLAERQVESVRNESTQQIAMLRGEIEWHVKNSVEAEENIGQLRKEIETLKHDQNVLKGEMEKKRQREADLERMVVSEKNRTKALHEEHMKLQEQLGREEEDRQKLAEQLKKLKLENATLHEREKFASLEKTMLESKMAEVDKKLHYSLEDLNKKIETERRRLEKVAMEKLEEFRRKHQTEVDRLKKEHDKKLQDTLLTYVSGENYARLETRCEEALKRAQDAETLLAERELLLEKVKADLEEVTEKKNNEIAAERRRREKLNKRLILQKLSYNEIRQELETYRQLIENLDHGNQTLMKTPISSKKTRPLMSNNNNNSMATPRRLNSIFATTNDASAKKRQTLLRKVLTPKRNVGTPKRPKLAQPAPTSKELESGVQPNCKVM